MCRKKCVQRLSTISGNKLVLKWSSSITFHNHSFCHTFYSKVFITCVHSSYYCVILLSNQKFMLLMLITSLKTSINTIWKFNFYYINLFCLTKLLCILVPAPLMYLICTNVMQLSTSTLNPKKKDHIWKPKK